MGLSVEVSNGLKEAGVNEPTVVQIKAIPLGKEGKDLVVQVTPGTGKTITFSSLALDSVRLENRLPQVIILSPTRDLARVTCGFINRIGKFIPAIISQCFVPGGPLTEDIIHLVDCQIVTGTPERVNKLIVEKHLNTSEVKLFVLNELDNMMDRGFADAIESITMFLAQKVQFLIFSAKYSPEALTFVKKITKSEQPTMLLSFSGTKLYYVEFPPDVAFKAIFEWSCSKMFQVLKSFSWNRSLIYISNFDKENHSFLLNKLNEFEWPWTIFPTDLSNTNDNLTTESVREKQIAFWQSIKKSNNKIIILSKIDQLNYISGVNLLFCLESLDDPRILVQAIGSQGPDIYPIVFGSEQKIADITKICESYHMNSISLPAQISPNFSSSAAKRTTEYEGILVPPPEMIKFQEIAKKAKTIQHLMDTETWTHPRQQDISKKIRKWKQEFLDVSNQKEKSPEVHKVPPISPSLSLPELGPHILSVAKQEANRKAKEKLEMNAEDKIAQHPPASTNHSQNSKKTLYNHLNKPFTTDDPNPRPPPKVQNPPQAQPVHPHSQPQSNPHPQLHPQSDTNENSEINPEELYDPHFDRQNYLTAFVKDEPSR
uniref:Helicase ATP-binding domain-containing protein n=1 Tax=Arcella intermedia TaxID=1963864 RepID=A0A6B2L010_9EUKA